MAEQGRVINAKNLKELILKMLLSQAGQKEKGVLHQDTGQKHQTTPSSISLTGVNIYQAQMETQGAMEHPTCKSF